MNKHTENFLKSVEKKLPAYDLLSGRELVEAGIVKNVNTLSLWRAKKTGPDFIRISKGQIKYLRSGVMEWLRSRVQPC